MDHNGDNVCFYSSHTANQLEYSYEQAAVLKLNAMADSSALNNKMLDIIQPEYCVINVYEENTYGMPDESVCSMLEQNGTEVFRTDRDYSVDFTYDKGILDVQVLNKEK